MASDRPKVFQPGTVTVVHRGGVQAVYAGGTLMTMASSASCGPAGVHVFFRRPPGSHENVLDQEMRAVKACGATASWSG